MNNKLFGAYELGMINCDRLKKIKDYALFEYHQYTDRIINVPLSIKQPINNRSLSPKCRDTVYQKNITKILNWQTLEQYIIYRANSQKFKFNMDVEKIYFACSCIFPNDEKFLNILNQHNYLSIFDEFIETYFYIDEKYEANETLAKMQKCMQYKKLMKVHSNEIVQVQNYFSKFHCITDIHLIINKLLQIYYFNFELYNSYIKSNKTKRLTKKS